MDNEEHTDPTVDATTDAGQIDNDSNSTDNDDQIVNKQNDEVDWMYDEQADDEDAKWIETQYPSTTDAILSCPLCFTQICFTCQHHVKYPGQFRALSVEHCETGADEWYTFGKGLLETVGDLDAIPREDLYHPVRCAECGTKVGVIDCHQVYHLFHVLTDS
ncbi:hypothetical protein GGI12_004969 [Dipsacomyces acuminosporus]|nr:hypothetical protein GGI12_004969 [Dipsacomyces acuminosporus]